jgi:hypothetical protein
MRAYLSGVQRKPGYMGKRTELSKDERLLAAYARQRAAHERVLREAQLQAEEREREAKRERVLDELTIIWGGERNALLRLDSLSRELHELENAEAELRRERDRLITSLRVAGHSWDSLAMRTGLSRQALSKRA